MALETNIKIISNSHYIRNILNNSTLELNTIPGLQVNIFHEYSEYAGNTVMNVKKNNK